MASKRIQLMSIKERLKALNRKDYLIICFSVSALLVIFAYLLLTNIFIPPTIPDFELQVKNCLYNPSTGSFSVSGTFGIQVPREYYYSLAFVSIIDGNQTIDVRNRGFCAEYFSSHSLYPSPGGYPAGPDWHFYILKGITLESKNVQLTFKYTIGYGIATQQKVLERGTEVFSVNVENA